ncbi:MAG: hypothetical protein ACT7A5_04570, partial [Ferrovibrionaceae bacterium]
MTTSGFFTGINPVPETVETVADLLADAREAATTVIDATAAVQSARAATEAARDSASQAAATATGAA